MNLLLDTHVFLWSLLSPEKLSETASCEIRSPKNDVAVSVVTFWEISLKFALGKMTLAGIKPEDLPDFAHQMDMEIISVTPQEASSVYKLPRFSHKDPFDRLIIWQAISRKLTLVTRDGDFGAYRDVGLKAFC
jgi:PIN domain nuclease of toxin-antitoxin system